MSIAANSSGNVVYSAVFSPYGKVHHEWVKNYDPKLKFSGKEREQEGELDHFGARYYGHTQYRFLSVDPVINKDDAIENPQLWNLYAYCRNNPITYLDPDGRDIKESIKNWWKDAPIRHFIEGNFKAGILQAIENLSTQLEDPSIIWGFVGGGIKYTPVKPMPLRGSRNPIVRKAIEIGNMEHKKFYKYAENEGWVANKAIKGTRLRPDAMDFTNRIVYELKPPGNLASKIGLIQAEGYAKAAARAYGGEWLPRVVKYKK